MNNSNSNSNNNGMMSSMREYIPDHQHRYRGFKNNNNNRSTTTTTTNSFSSSSDDHINTLDLFSKSRTTSLSLPDDHPDVLVNLGRLSIGSTNIKHKIDDFLSSAAADQCGKHDYDWLLTPPGTPLFADDGSQKSLNNNIAPRTKPSSRLSLSLAESNYHVSKRSSCMTRPSLSTSQYNTTNSNTKSTNILNTSSASVSSYIRPSTPTRSSSRPSTPSARSSTLSRSTTPSRTRPSPAMDKPRTSTPTSRSQISPAKRVTTTSSRPSTPIRRSTTPSLSPVSVPTTPGSRSLPNGRNSVSRPSSPSPQVRSTGQTIDFPLDTPPNLRTTLPDRPISAGRSRPGAAKGNVEPLMMTNNNSSARGRQPSPVVIRGRHSEYAGRSHRTLAPANENLCDAALDSHSRRELLTRKPAKASTDNTGYGRTISKKSLDMSIKHMDIRNGSNGSRPLTGSNLFPQSIRSGKVSVNKNQLSIGAVAEKGNHINARFNETGSEENRNQSSAKLSNIDIYESSRYDMILPKEDLTNTNWLHSLDDKTDQGPIFDNGFELLPEPFDPL